MAKYIVSEQQLRKLIRLIVDRQQLHEGQLEKKLLSLKQVLDKIKDRVIIFLDTETTTLDPRKDFAQITEIAAVAYDVSSGKMLETFHMKVNLRDSTLERMAWEKDRIDGGNWKAGSKSVEDLLAMTKYREENATFSEEEDVLRQFREFVNRFAEGNPIIAAHNSRFDLYQIGKALERNNVDKLPRLAVVDTKVLTKNYLFPLLDILEKQGDSPEALELIAVLRPKKTYLNRLGNLGDAFKVSTEHWHSALADTQQLMGIFAKVIDFFSKHA